MLIATPNLCLDVTVRIPQLVPGGIHRATSTTTTAGGKGVNVSRAARALSGVEAATPVLMGFLPVDDGDRFARLYQAEESGRLLPVAVPGVMRLATILLPADGPVTVINGRGPDIDPATWSRFCSKLARALTGQDVLLCSGSLPPGVPVDGYAQLVRLARSAGVPVLVDAAPAVLEAALPAGPDLVSPNLSEAEGLLDGRVDEQVHEEGDDIPDRAIRAAKELHARGARRAVVTAGSAGAALATDDGSWWLEAVRVDAVNPIGAGDCFAAGAALALTTGASDVDVVRRGMAAATASVEHPVAGRLDPARAAGLFEQITAVSR
ncbi:1-phosphofructokinase family hexose kinase [Nakamurella alba]|nr:PfkB family carbohydrate kinase [Nakamurella alba]